MLEDFAPCEARRQVAGLDAPGAFRALEQVDVSTFGEFRTINGLGVYFRAAFRTAIRCTAGSLSGACRAKRERDLHAVCACPGRHALAECLNPNATQLSDQTRVGHVPNALHPSVASITDWLQNGANGLTLLLGLAAIVAFILSRVALAQIIRRYYVRELSKPLARDRATVKKGLTRGVEARINGDAWPIASEYHGLTVAEGRREWWVPWSCGEQLSELATAYERAGARLRRSLTLRLGAGTDFAAGEARLADVVGSRLLADSDFKPSPSLGQSPSEPLANLLRGFGAHILLWPPYGLDSYYADVRCTQTGEHFGAPDLPFHLLAPGSAKGRWSGVRSELADRLDDRVRDIARQRLEAMSPDFNGRVLRLRRWRAESSESSLAARLHLLADSTNFASVLATSGGLHLVEDEAWRRTVEALCLDRHLNGQDASGEESFAANHLVVHLGIVTADRQLALTRRGTQSEFYPGTLNSAVNGVVEIAPRAGLLRGDYDDDGFVDVLATALREADEELGDRLGLRRENLVIRALGLNHTKSEVTPYVLLEARTELTLEAIARRQFATASRHEGAFEVGSELVGLPLAPTTARNAVGWLRERRDDLTLGGLVSGVFALGYQLDGDTIAEAWKSAPPLQDEQLTRVPV